MAIAKSTIAYLGILLVLLILAFSSAQSAGVQDGLLKIYFFDVGQGDAIFIQAPNGSQVLVDGGPDAAVIERLQEVMPLSDRSLDAVVVSHPHSDHLAGLIDVLGAYEVGTVLEAKEEYDSATFREWRAAVQKEGSAQVEAAVGKVLELGGGLTLTVVYPAESFQQKMLKEVHEANVTVLVKYQELEVLLTGDMESDAEQMLITAGAPIDVDVLKIGHHGSKTSTSAAFLSATTPQVAIISVGAKNRYGHPAPSTTSRLENFGIKYYRTDINGTVRLISDGERYVIESY